MTTPENQTPATETPVQETAVKIQPPKLALAVSKASWYEWAENTAYGTKLSTHPVLGENIYLADINETSAKEFFELPTALLIRPQCETNEGFLQVLPYVVLRVKNAGVSAKDVEVFAYQRGKAGTESRLHGDFSIGFGGHMEEQPTKDFTFLDAVVDCVQRELMEEVALKVERQQVLDALGKAVVFHDCSNAVGKVHLSLTLVIDVTDDQLSGREVDQIDNVRKLNAVQMREDAKEGKIRLESWTRILLNQAWDFWWDK